MSLSQRENQILRLAESWIGTPYRHQARIKHVGCDCLGLVLGVWEELYGKAPIAKTNYSKDWAETSDRDHLLLAAQSNLCQIDFDSARPGDVILFRWSQFSVSKHLGILAQSAHMIHAFEGHAVSKALIVPSWRRRISGVFRFPETIRD
ncbi:MAG: NlpC/P60 family protein [Pseudomonadota bacterium]